MFYSDCRCPARTVAFYILNLLYFLSVPDHMEIFILLENKVGELVYERGFCVTCATDSDDEASQPSYHHFYLSG